MTRRCNISGSTPVSVLVEELSDILSASEETLTSDISSLSTLTVSWDDTAHESNTGRTSSYSLREDKFDRLAANDVRSMFEVIDSELYEDGSLKPSNRSHPVNRALRYFHGGSTGNVFGVSQQDFSFSSGQRMQKEGIDEWKAAFPHLRICGVSLTGATDEGIQVYPFEGTEKIAAKYSLASTQESQEQSLGWQSLNVTGKTVDTICPTSPGKLRSSSEEIFVLDGSMEEIIAVDYRNGDELAQRSRNMRLGGIPPITPLGCIHSNIIDSVFDESWREVVSQLQLFLRRHCKPQSNQTEFLKDSFKHPGFRYCPSDRQRSHSPPHEMFPGHSVSSFEKSLSRVGGRDQAKLTSLLRIQPKALTTREKLEPNILPLHSAAAASSTSTSESSILFVQVTNNSSRNNDSLSSAVRRFGTRDRLEAIHDDDGESSMSITTIEIRGQGLHGTRIDPLSSLSLLPSITPESHRMMSGVSSASAIGTKGPGRRLTYRVNSALTPKSGRLLTADRPATIPSSRPITENGLYHKLEMSNVRPSSRRHSATNTSSNMRNLCLLKSMMGSSSSQPQVKGIGLQRYHTVIS